MRGPTRILLAATGLLWAVEAAVRLAPGPASAEPSRLPGFDPAAATRLEIGRADAATVLERDGEGWALLAPVRGRADAAEVEAALAALAGGIRPSALVDRGDHGRYGLDGGRELRVEVRGSAGPLASVVLGDDAGGGDAWVRLPGSPEVWRAPVGGRALFDRLPSGWLDRQLADLDPAGIRSLVLRSGGRERRVERVPGGFTPGVDPELAARVIADLARLRGVEPAQDAPVALADVELSGDTGSVELRLWAEGGRAFARRADRPEAYRVLLPWVGRLADPAFLEDRAVWTLPVEAVREARAEGPGWDGAITRDRDGALRRVRPAGTEVEPGRLQAAVALLAAPRVERWETRDPTSAGFDGRRWVVETPTADRILEVGAEEGGHLLVREPARPDRIGHLDAELARKLATVLGGP